MPEPMNDLDLDRALRKARFVPTDSFKEDMRSRLQQRYRRREETAFSSNGWRRPSTPSTRTQKRDEELTMGTNLRWIPAFGAGIAVTLIAVLFAAVSGRQGFFAASQPTATQVSAISVVEGFFEAINAGNADAAMAFVADDAVTHFRGGRQEGKLQIEATVRQLILNRFRFELTNLQELNGTVFDHYKIYVNGNLRKSASDGVVLVKDGKLIFVGDASTFTTFMTPTPDQNGVVP